MIVLVLPQLAQPDLADDGPSCTIVANQTIGGVEHIQMAVRTSFYGADVCDRKRFKSTDEGVRGGEGEGAAAECDEPRRDDSVC